jgi:predicted peroxiredoxin
MTQGRYVFIESRDPFESTDTAFVADAATALRTRGRDVAVFLLQNGVLATRAAAHGSQVARLVEAGVTVLADDFSLRERGIVAGELGPGVQEASMGTLVDLMMRPDAKTIWH